MKSLLKIFVILLVITIAMPAFAQFRQIRTIELANIGINDTFGITVNHEAGQIYVIHLRRSIIGVYTLDWEQVERIQMPGQDLYGIDYNPEDNSIWAADYGGRHIYQLDLEGNSIRDWAYQQGPLAICKHPENDNLFVGDVNRVMHEITVDNEEVASMQMDDIPTSVIYYPPNNTLFIMTSNDRIREYTLDLELVQVVMNDDGHGGNGLGLAYDAWTSILYSTWQSAGVIEWEDNYGAMPEMAMEPEEFDMQIPLGLEGEETLRISNVGEEGSTLRYSLSDIGEGIDWLTCDPVAGIVGAGEEIEVGLLVATEELEPGNLARTIVLRTNSPEHREVEIPVAITVIAGYGELRGTVIDPATEDPIGGALIFVERFGFEAVTNDEGIYVFEEIPEWIYNVRISADDYLPQRVEEVQVIEDEVTVLDFELLHSVCDLSIDNINEQLAINEEIEIDFTMANTGNGPLTWTANRVFPEGMDAEPWEHRAGLCAGETVGNNRLGGVEFLGDNFYVAGGILDGLNQMYILDRDGNLVNQYDQLGDSRYGYRDLAWDGQSMWGIDDNLVYAFSIDGEQETVFDSPVGSPRGLAWDRSRGLLWIAGITTDICGVNTNGELVVRIGRPEEGLRIYGLAYYPDDADGFNLYAFCSNGEVNRQIFKINPETEEVAFVVEPEAEGTTGACTVTRAWDPFSWVFMAITNSPDNIEIWHLEAPTGWVAVEPAAGVLGAGEDLDLIVSLNTFGFPVDIEFTVNLVFDHNGVGGETIIPIGLTALGDGGGGPEERTVALNFGWNMISVNVEPENNDVRALTQSLVDEDLMEMMKNGSGQFYSPAFGFCNIPGWDVTDGYLIKATAECELTIEGMPVAADAPIPLVNGWQMKAYFPRVPVDAIVALSGIVDNLEMAKDGSGRFYSPAFGFSNMGDLMEGRGYMLKMSEAMDLVYVVEEDQVAQANASQYRTPEFFPVLTPTPENMSLLIQARNSIDMSNMEIGVFASSRLVGSGRFENGRCGLAVWGNDPTTDATDGALDNENLELRLYDGTNNVELTKFISLSGTGSYKMDGFWVVEFAPAVSIPCSFGIVSAYPNPFNNVSHLSFNLTESGKVDLALFDLNGRRISDLYKGQSSAGVHTVAVDAVDLPSGMYVVRLSTVEGVSKYKLTLVK